MPAEVDASNNFRGTATLSGATTTVTLKAKDASGNETTKQYEVDASGSTTSYSYDANGNLTSDGTKTYFWNALNQLVEVKEGSTTIATFEYDGAGRRTEKVAAGLTHQYVYDALDIVEDRISGSSTDTIRYYHGAGIDEPLARKNSSDVVTYYLADHLGSIVQETSASGAVTLEREYDAWGVAIQGVSTSGYGFTGREWDAELAMYFYRARYYRPAEGQFIGRDPVPQVGSDYAYVNGRPVTAIDPHGEFLFVLAPPALAALEAALVYTGATLAGLAIADVLTDAIDHVFFADKAKKQNQRDSGLENVSDQEVSRRARDKSLSSEERRRYQKEEKARGLRNRAKRDNKTPKTPGGGTGGAGGGAGGASAFTPPGGRKC